MNTQDIFNIALASKLAGGSGAKTLGELTDVNVDSVTNNQIIKYDSSSSTWVNSDVPSELPVPTLSDIGKIPTVNSLGAWELAKPSSDVAVFYASITVEPDREVLTLLNSKKIQDIYDAIQAEKIVIIDAEGSSATNKRELYLYQRNEFVGSYNKFRFSCISFCDVDHNNTDLFKVSTFYFNARASMTGNKLCSHSYYIPQLDSYADSDAGKVLGVVKPVGERRRWELVNLWKDITGTLTTGQTSIVLSDASITTSSTIQVFTDTGINYTAISVATGSVTITYPSQQSDVNVKVRVS